MNIKSELNKSISWFAGISLKLFILSIIVGLILGIIAVNIGSGVVLIKVLFLIIGIIISLALAYDNHNDRTRQDLDAKSNVLCVLIAFCVLEFCLFITSSNKYVIPIGSYIKETTKSIVIETEPNTGKVLKTENKTYKTIVYINLNTNQEIGSRSLDDGDQKEKVELLTNIIGKEEFIQYTPFLRYYEDFRYIRKNQNN